MLAAACDGPAPPPGDPGGRAIAAPGNGAEFLARADATRVLTGDQGLGAALVTPATVLAVAPLSSAAIRRAMACEGE